MPDDGAVSTARKSRGVAVGVICALVLSGCGLTNDAASFATTSMQLTSSFVQSRSSQPFLVRYVPSSAASATSVFDLQPGQAGGGLASRDSWAGRLEVLRDDCSVVGTIDLEPSAHSFVVVKEDGMPERVSSAEVLDGPTDAALGRVRRCGG